MCQDFHLVEKICLMSWRKRFMWTGRLTFFAIYTVQFSFLAKYIYDFYSPDDKPAMTAIVILLAPALLVWLGLVIWSTRCDKKPIPYICVVWFCYTFGFSASVFTIFAKKVEKLNTSMEFGSNRLKMTLCLAPVLLLLLINTTVSATKNPKLIQRLSMAIALDLFDGIEMLDVIMLQGKELTIPESMKIAMLTFVCIGFVVSSVALYQHKFDLEVGEVKNRRKVTILRAGIQIALVNSAFLILRSILWARYKFSASIFITKNAISIVSCVTDIIAICTQENTSETIND